MKPPSPGHQAAFEAAREDMGPLLHRMMKRPSGTGIEYTWKEINDLKLGARDQIEGRTLLGSLVLTYPGEWNRFLNGRLESHERLNQKAILRQYNLTLPLNEREKAELKKGTFASLDDGETALRALRPEVIEATKNRVTNWVNWKTNPFIESYMVGADKKGKVYRFLCRMFGI